MKKMIFPFITLIACSLFYACKPNPKGGNIENTYWTLTSAKQGAKTVAPVQKVTISLVFGQGKLTGTAPCNSYFADFSTNGTALTLGEVGATKRMCDDMDQENSYLGLLSKAQSYTALKDRLVIYTENGQLTFVPMAEDAVKKIEQEQGVGKLETMFPAIGSQDMLHLYPILQVDNPGSYPYKGQLVDPSFYRFFDDETAEIWSSAGGEVMAVGQHDGLFICRIPGRYVSSDIALFKIKGGKFTRAETVAWAWCDEGWCNQQDSWLRDVNEDGATDLIQHYTLTDDKGKVREERMTVLVQDENGNFKEDKTLVPDKSEFKMASI